MEKVIENISFSNRLERATWQLIYLFFFRCTPNFFFKWRVFILRFFGADVSWKARVYPSAKIWLPKNLKMAEGSCIASGVNVYNVAFVTLEKGAIVSQFSHICTATHNINSKNFDLLKAPITFEETCWIAADVFVGPGVTIGKGSVCYARSVVIKSTEPFGIYGGNPVKMIGYRKIQK